MCPCLWIEVVVNFRLALDRLPKYDLIISFFHRRIVLWCCRVELRVRVALEGRVYVAIRGDISATPEAVESSRRAVIFRHPDITSQLKLCLIPSYQSVRRIKFELRDRKRMIQCAEIISPQRICLQLLISVSRNQ